MVGWEKKNIIKNTRIIKIMFFAAKLLDYTIVLLYILWENKFFLLMTSPRSARYGIMENVLPNQK